MTAIFRRPLRQVLLCAAFAAGLCASGAALAQDTASRIRAADNALHEGHADRAAALYGQALQAPDFTGYDRARALLNRGFANKQLGNHEEAISDFTAAIALHLLPPTDLARALLDRAVTLDEMGKADEALADYSAAISVEPDFAAALNNRGNAYRRRGDYENAKRDYEASLSAGNATPEYPLAGLGQIAEVQGNKRAALGFYQEAHESNPNYALVNERIAALTREAKSDEAGNVAAPATHAVAKTQKNPPASMQRATAPEVAPKVARIEHPQPAKPGMQVQLGSYRDEASASDGWKHFAAKAGDLLGNLTPEIVKADIPGKGIYYRLRTGPLPMGTDANTLCQALQTRGLACLVVR